MLSTKKGKNKKGCEQGKGWKQVHTGHSAFRDASEKLVPGSGIYTRARGMQLLRTLTSNAGVKGSLPGNTRFHRLRHPQNPASPRLLC